jgi:hypothetical protein
MTVEESPSYKMKDFKLISGVAVLQSDIKASLAILWSYGWWFINYDGLNFRPNFTFTKSFNALGELSRVSVRRLALSFLLLYLYDIMFWVRLNYNILYGLSSFQEK